MSGFEISSNMNLAVTFNKKVCQPSTASYLSTIQIVSQLTEALSCTHIWNNPISPLMSSICQYISLFQKLTGSDFTRLVINRLRASSSWLQSFKPCHLVQLCVATNEHCAKWRNSFFLAALLQFLLNNIVRYYSSEVKWFERESGLIVKSKKWHCWALWDSLLRFLMLSLPA